MKSFEVMQKMSDDNMDIQLAPLKNIIRAQVVNGGGEITIGVSEAVILDLMKNRDFRGGLVLCDGKQFDELLKQSK